MSKIEIKELVKAGVHFGHLTRKWNPNMSPYIYSEKNGIHIINLYKTVNKLEEACSALEKISSSGKISQISFGFGILISEKTSFGISINSINNQENYTFRFDQNDQSDNFNIFPSDFLSYSLDQSLQLRAKGNRITIGLLTEITSNLNTGFNINLPFTYNVNEKHLLKENLTFDDNSLSDTTLIGCLLHI